MLNVSATKPVVKKKRVAPELPTEIYAKRLKMKLGTSSIGTPHVTEQGGNMYCWVSYISVCINSGHIVLFGTEGFGNTEHFVCVRPIIFCYTL